ncbi:MAG: tetratricopeptide repeat protein [Candidatus Rhabdochlamydia sp.]
MTIRPRSSSYEHVPSPEISLENASSSIALKKIKQLSAEAPETSTPRSFQRQDFLEPQIKQDRDYALMSNPDVSIRQIRYITTKRWIQAIDHEPHNAALIFNYGRMHPLLKHDQERGRDCTKEELFELTCDMKSSHKYMQMTQQELYKQAIEKGFSDQRLHKNLVKECMFIDYSSLGKCYSPSGVYQGTLNLTPVINNMIRLIELNPHDDRNYALLGKVMRYQEIPRRQKSHSNNENQEKILFPLGIQKEEELYLKALELNPRNDEAYIGLGLLAEKNGGERIPEPYLKALHLNPHNLEAAILLASCQGIMGQDKDRVRPISDYTITFPDGSVKNIGTVIENAVQYAPHYLAIMPHWHEVRDLTFMDPQKNYFSIILKKFIDSSIEKHIKRNTIKYFIKSMKCASYSECFQDIANLLFLLSKTHLVDRDEDRKLIENYFNSTVRFGLCCANGASLNAEFLQAHFPNDKKALKELNPFFIEGIEGGWQYFPHAYYHLGAFISPHETIKIGGQYFTQQELYFEAASAVYHMEYRRPPSYYYPLDIVAKILGHYALTLKEEDNGKEEIEQYDVTSFKRKDTTSLTKKNLYLKSLSIASQSAWPYFYLGKEFKNPIEIQGKLFNSAQELFLEALNVDRYHADTYHHLGNLLSSEESITLQSRVTLTCQQLYTRAIQLGTRAPDAYFQAAKLMKKGGAILLFDGFTYLSKIDLLFKAFSLDLTSSYYLNQIALYFKKPS